MSKDKIEMTGNMMNGDMNKMMKDIKHISMMKIKMPNKEKMMDIKKQENK